MIDRTNRFKGCLLGLACGDAVGATVEFKVRNTFEFTQQFLEGARI